MLALGLMSGTSGDGLSVALTEFKNFKFRLIRYQTFNYPGPLSKKLIRLGRSGRKPLFSIAELSKLNRALGKFFAEKTFYFLKQTGIPFRKIRVIGSHGHTIFHGPDENPPSTFQIGEPSFLAERTGIPVVSDFRQRDIAAGGEGAPLIPFFDQTFFGAGPLTACQNIGGIANVTLAGGNLKVPIAFDNGPGNCLIDEAVTQYYESRSGGFDRNGKIARSGRIHEDLIKKLIRHPYFKKRPPKSTGRELFRLPLLQKKIKKKIQPCDLIATLTFFTAYSIVDSYRKFLPRNFKRVIVSGGGAKNLTLMDYLKDLLAPVPVYSIERFGIPAQAKEPIAFAFFALRAVQGKVNHLAHTTGARTPRILGKITF